MIESDLGKSVISQIIPVSGFGKFSNILLFKSLHSLHSFCALVMFDQAKFEIYEDG